MQTVKLIKAEKLRRILVSIFYAAAIFVLIYFSMHSQTQDERFQYLFFLIFVPAGVYYEVLRWLYAKASDTLNNECDAEECLKLTSILIKADITKRFQISTNYLQIFALVDLNCPDEAEKKMEFLDSTLPAKRKMDFEYNYLRFILSNVRGERKSMKVYYDGMHRIFNINSRVSGDIRSLESMINAVWFYNTHCYEAAEKSFRSVKPEALKQREKAYYYYYFSAFLYSCGKKCQAKEAYKKACETAPQLPYIMDVCPFKEETNGTKDPK